MNADMRRATVASGVMLLATLAACGSPGTVDVPATQNVISQHETGGILKQASNVWYRDFIEGDPEPGVPVILFFHQNADPFSQRSDRYLRQWYGSGAASISTLRLDAGAASGMTLAYSVLLPDTFVLLNASGSKAASILHPTMEELRSLISPLTP